MVLTEKNEDCEVIFTGKKKYKRVFLKNGVEWRRFKTNNQVTREQQEALEEEYRANFSATHVVTFRKDKFDLRKDSDRVMLENNLVSASDNGKLKLAGVKRVKEITGWGLKESKEYADLFFQRRDLYNKATSSTVEEEVERRLVKFMKTNDSKLACVKYVKRITGWTLLESKNFFEEFIKFKEAQRIVEKRKLIKNIR